MRPVGDATGGLLKDDEGAPDVHAEHPVQRLEVEIDHRREQHDPAAWTPRRRGRAHPRRGRTPRTSSTLATSPPSVIARPPDSVIDPAAFYAGGVAVVAHRYRHPLGREPVLTTRPMPPEPPVTTATRSVACVVSATLSTLSLARLVQENRFPWWRGSRDLELREPVLAPPSRSVGRVTHRLRRSSLRRRSPRISRPTQDLLMPVSRVLDPSLVAGRVSVICQWACTAAALGSWYEHDLDGEPVVKSGASKALTALLGTTVSPRSKVSALPAGSCCFSPRWRGGASNGRWSRPPRPWSSARVTSTYWTGWSPSIWRSSTKAGSTCPATTYAAKLRRVLFLHRCSGPTGCLRGWHPRMPWAGGGT